MQELISLAIHASLFLIIFAIGLDAGRDDIAYVLRRPKLLLRSLAAIVVAVPAAAALIVLALPLMPVVEIGILLMAASPFPPFLPGKEIKLGGRKAYVYGLLFAIAVLSAVIVPVVVAILGAIFGADVSVPPAAVAKLVFGSVILPLAAGMAMRRFVGQRAERIAPAMNKAANIAMLVAILPVLYVAAPALLRLIGSGTVVAIAAVVASGLLAGHLLGGPDRRDRATLAISSSARHPAIALLIADANSAEPNVKAAILLFVIVGVLATIPYQVWFKRHYPALP